jgi:integrase
LSSPGFTGDCRRFRFGGDMVATWPVGSQRTEGREVRGGDTAIGGDTETHQGSVATRKLTKAVVHSLPSRDRVYIVYDDTLKGFGVRVTPNGARSWIVEYRPHGGGRGIGKKRITLGDIAHLTPDQARQAAADALASVRLNKEVTIDRAARRESPLLSELVDEFMRDEVRPIRKGRTAELYEMYFRRHVVPALGTKRAREVSRADVAKLHRKIGAKAPVTANRVVILISGLYSWAARNGRVPEEIKPARGISKFREQGRERFLTSEEVGRLGEALREAETVGLPWVIDQTNPKAKHAPKKNRITKVSPDATAAIRLLLLTGCRLREILNLRWAEYDQERGMLLLPDSKTGRKPVVLSSAAMALLNALPRAGQHVIMGKDSDQARRDLKRPWEAIRQRAGLGPVRLHDLRHTFAATGAGSSLGLPIIGKLLGHKNVETTNRYAHLAADPLRAAADAIAGHLAAILGEDRSREGGQVIRANFGGKG